jgi:pSer/pThr/pTyr-binding forkhead associated (FHA) protein
MPFCTQCGQANTEDSKFCAHCGAVLHIGTAELTSTMSLSSISESAEGEPADSAASIDQLAIDALPSGSALLVVHRGPNAGSRFLLDQQVTTVGRHPDSDIFFDDVTVSRRHAEFLREGLSFSVRDTGSLNGSYVNRSRIDAAELMTGDEVQIGKYRLVFHLARTGATQEPEGTDSWGAL